MIHLLSFQDGDDAYPMTVLGKKQTYTAPLNLQYELSKDEKVYILFVFVSLTVVILLSHAQLY